MKCGAQESDCTFILAHHLLSKLADHPFTKWTVDIRRSSLHVPASVVNIPLDYIVILALVCFIRTHPNLTTKYMKKTLQLFKLNLLDYSSELF